MSDHERTGHKVAGMTFTHAMMGGEVIQFEADGSATNITHVLELEAELREKGELS